MERNVWFIFFLDQLQRVFSVIVLPFDFLADRTSPRVAFGQQIAAQQSHFALVLSRIDCSLVALVLFPAQGPRLTDEDDGQTIDAPLGRPLTLPCRLPGAATHRQVTETSWQKWPSFASHPSDDAPRKRRPQRRRSDDPHNGRVLEGSELRFESIGEADDGLYRCSALLSHGAAPDEVDVSGRESTVPAEATPREEESVVRGGFIRIRVQGVHFLKVLLKVLSKVPARIVPRLLCPF